MKACPSCGARTLESDLFCASCGTRLSPATEEACRKCGAPVAKGDRHCRRCGIALADDLTQALPTGEQADRDSPGTDRPYDTQVLPQTSRPAEPYLAPRSRAPEPERGDQGAWQYDAAPPRRGEAPVGAIIALIAAAAVVASGFLEWRAEALGGGTAAEIPLRFLADPEASARAGEITIALLLLGLGTLGALTALLSMLVRWLRFLRRLIGGFTLLVPIVFVIRTELELRFLSGDHDFLDSIGRGVWLCAISAVVEIVSGRWFRR